MGSYIIRPYYKVIKVKKNLITRQDYNIILVIVDKLTKQGYFIACIEEILIEDIARIYIKEVFIRYRDLRFIAVF